MSSVVLTLDENFLLCFTDSLKDSSHLRTLCFCVILIVFVDMLSRFKETDFFATVTDSDEISFTNYFTLFGLAFARQISPLVTLVLICRKLPL